VGQRLDSRLARLAAPDVVGLVRGGLRGVERECLRVTREGLIAQTGHPVALGSTLTNEYITTDYSEALLEFVTPPVTTNWETVQFLCDIHQFTVEALGDELLWPLSMPCRIRSEADIPLARYGTSNIGTMKTVYRRGLGYRYGRYMQAIAGIHYNYSLPDGFWPLYQDFEGDKGSLQDFRSATYLGAVRNVRRLDWLLLYLFGASPAVCKCFIKGIDARLDELDADTLYGPHATSLRMSDLGYRNSAQADLVVSPNSLEEYIRDLSRATRTPRPEFERIGIKVDGIYRQLNANQLQIENEFYSTIRPKRVTARGERPTDALARGGVQYIELRALDISPYDPVGLNQRQLRFLETFLIYCMLLESPPISRWDQEHIDANHGLVAREGRKPDLRLYRGNRMVSLREWGLEICRDMEQVAALLDPDGTLGHVAAIRHQLEVVEDAERTPSARMLAELRARGQSLFQYGLEQAVNVTEYFRSLAPELNRNRERLVQAARDSLAAQAELEATDDVSFDEYLARYMAQ
jgi:glutamate--cysteine ligase